MTLMEAVVALVILSLVAVGCLELSQGASQLELSATEWNRAVTAAESRMAQYTSGAPRDGVDTTGTQVTRASWKGGLDVVTVSVPVARGKRFELRRVVPATSQPIASASR